MSATDAREALNTLMVARKPGATICPSEVARAIASKHNWREAMPLVHAMVDTLLTEGLIHLSWKGTSMSARSGPYRIAPAESERDGHN
ncbi:DUF3253 domain-containing protein [Sphingobium sp. WCS2017Hpa-17]|uniref:DUF3253 domain-containing protein n=1 Tax=Sphingobium sp. WCS2017Hpa-17 TaxID=3073638 RepID=UPI00288B78ED|nr:DUF3253 domain-containing protein [Sphingobium sp. WCS2017Hpa-17]